LKRYGFHGEAEVDLSEAAAWYRDQSIHAATGFEAELSHTLDLIRRSPLQFPVRKQKVRSAILRRFPYSIIFRDTSEEIQIIAVAHAKRRPNYWAKRTFRTSPTPP
jgi:toxin ParE1/3/4